MAKFVMMRDCVRNKVVGVFKSTKEALKYAKEEVTRWYSDIRGVLR